VGYDAVLIGNSYRRFGDCFYVSNLEPVDGGTKLLRNFGNTNRHGVTSQFHYLNTARVGTAGFSET